MPPLQGRKGKEEQEGCDKLAHTKNGSRMNVIPGARSCTMVTMKLIEPSSDEVMRKNIPINQAV